MAIVKMQKFNLITFRGYQETIMEKLQDFQEVELFPAEKFSADSPDSFKKMQEHPKLEELENQIAQLAWARSFLDRYLSSSGMIKRLKEPLQRYTLNQLSEHADTYDWMAVYQELRAADKRLRILEQERRELSEQENALNIWRYFDEQPSILETFEQAGGMLGTIPNSELPSLSKKIGELPNTYLETIHQTTTTTYLLVLFHKDSRKKAANTLRIAGFEEYHYPFDGKPSQDLQEIKQQSEKLIQEETSLKESLRNKRDDYHSLGIAAEYLESKLARVSRNKELLESDYTFNLSGWVPIDKAQRLVKQIEKAVGQEYYLEFKEITEENTEEIPILLKNHSLVEPFEGLVGMYSLPQYDELDPTPLMAPFYAIAFGMMVADFGYGLLLFAAIFTAKRIFHFKPSMKRNLTFFEICAIPTMMWGLIYGNIFGFEFSFQLLSPSSDITQILILSVIFGYFQVLFALGLKFYILWGKKNERSKAFFQAGSWIFFLLSALVLVIGMMLLPDSPLQQIGLIGMIASLVLIVIGGSFDGQTIVGKIGAGLYALMDVTSYLGDLISYTRLMALGVAGGSIAAAFNLIISYLPVYARFTIGILLFIVLHSLNIFLSFLSAYVHGIRLQYLEFFGKFFTGGGRPFSPLKAKEHYVEVISEEKQQQGEEG
jgi:V/A-type H+-transporting ATPase subunit I